MAENSVTSDFENAQPPPKTASLLKNSLESNEKTQSAFNDILRFPFLQEIRAGSLSDTTNSGIPVLQTISEGLTLFSSSQITDVSIVRKLSGFASTVPKVAAALPRGRLAEVLMGMVTRYAQFANKKSLETKQFHAKFAATISHTSDAIDALDSDLEVLMSDIQQLEDELEDKNDSLFSPFSFLHSNSGIKLLDLTRRRLRKYLAVEVSSEQSMISTLSLLFSVTADEMAAILRGENDDKPDIDKYVDLLKDLRRRLRDVRLLMTALLNNLRDVLRQSISLVSIWYLVQQQLEALAASDSSDERFSEEEVSTITDAWAEIKQGADAFTASVSDVSVSVVNTVFERNNEVVRRSLSFLSRSVAMKPRSAKLSPEENEALSKITTDEQTLESLKAMTSSSGKIVATFNKLLRVPFLDSLHVSAAANSGPNKDGSQDTPEESSRDVDLESLTLNFLQRYQKLQADTVPIARNLFSFAKLQQRLIPLLDSSLSIENYVKVNLSLIEKRREEAERVHALHNKFQQDWNTAILLVERAIGEQEENIKGIKAQLKELVKQKRNLTLGAVFTFIGAALFTAAAFFSGGLLFAFCGAAAIGLVVTGSTLASQAVQIQKGIDGYRAALRTAQETLSNFQFVLPIMTEVRDHLKSVTLIWNDITNKLTDLSTGTEAWEILAFTLQGDEWEPFLKAALENWSAVEKSVLAYVAQVSDVNPTVE